MIEKFVSTSISITVYYDLSQTQREDVHFDIETGEGAVGEYPGKSFISNEPGDTPFIRFEGLAFGDAEYFLVARSTEGEVLSDCITIN